MMEVMDIKDSYLSNFTQFEKGLGEPKPSALHRVRSAAMERFAELGFPTLRDEEWRFTNVAPLAQVPFALADRPDQLPTLDRFRPFLFESAKCHRLVFVNGRFAPELSAVGILPPGVVVSSLATVLEKHAGLVQPYLAQHVDYQEHAFTALNTAFLHDGACVLVPKGCVLAEPIHVLCVSMPANEPQMAHPRHLLVADVNSQAQIVESYVTLGEGVAFTNTVTETVLKENAVIEHTKLQQESERTFHIATLQVHQERSSNFTSHALSLGGGLVRNEINAVLDAEGCECTLNGLYLASGRQLIDNHTRIDHAKPHCASHELYKGILDGQSRGVFNGKIYVHPDAQKTDAKQTNQTLLLSSDAQIDTKPQLEIFADDVKCTHGATIGQLAEEMIFYLRSRGIGRDEARGILTFAFANDILSRLRIAPLRAQLEAVFAAVQPRPSGQEAVR